jgi:hypothetical protein
MRCPSHARTQFSEAARDHSVVFVGAEDGPFNVAALVGLRAQHNLMVDAQRQWATGCCEPAFARR